MRKVLSWIAVAIATFLIGAQFVHPDRQNPPVDASRTLEARVEVPREVSDILSRACADCHSNQTSWPWYSNVAPVSWYVADHVNHGRKHLNFSTWASYERNEAEEMLDSICREVKKGMMPLKSYTRLHPEAKLNAADVKTLCDWSDTAISRLASAHEQTPVQN
jgi:Haem-binding domain